MIKAITYRDIEENYKLYIGQHQLRYREFIERQNYDVKSLDGMEFDGYDSIASAYLVYTENDRQVLGLSRLTPIRFGCMLADHFGDLVVDHSIFQSNDNIWESTRFCIDRRLPAKDRLRICHALVAANLEFGMARDIDRIIGLMPTIILRSVFERSGVVLDRLGDVHRVGDHSKVQAAAFSVSNEQWQRVKATTGVSNVIYNDLPARRTRVA